MKIRAHTGVGSTLVESMETAVEIEATAACVAAYFGGLFGARWPVRAEDITLEPYGTGPDERIGWQATYLVLLKGQAIGYTDGPLDPEKQ